MENLELTQLNRRLWPVRTGLTIGLALLFLAALLWGLLGLTPASADLGTLYVDGASGQDIPTCGTITTPCQTISYALNPRASEGDTILIATGTYTENLTINGITVTLRGGYTISGTEWLTGTSQTVVNANYAGRAIDIQASNSVLEKLILTNGQTQVSCWGGGLWVSNGNVTIRSSVITSNTAGCSGGGIAVNSDLGPAQLTIEDSVVINNLSKQEGGGLAVWNASAVLIRTTIVSNTANDGSGDGRGGGIGAYNDSRLAVLDSIIKDNYAVLHGGGIEMANSTLDMWNTLIVGNTAESINVLAINSSAVTITNSTIADNNPQGAQAILAFDPATSTLAIHNSILWNNALDIQWDGPKGSVSVSYSDIAENWWTRTDDINADPRFVGGGRYQLQINSPCIDTGTNTGAPDHDLDWNSRPLDGDGNGTATTDMGAYEFRLYQLCLPLVLRDSTP